MQKRFNTPGNNLKRRKTGDEKKDNRPAKKYSDKKSAPGKFDKKTQDKDKFRRTSKNTGSEKNTDRPVKKIVVKKLNDKSDSEKETNFGRKEGNYSKFKKTPFRRDRKAYARNKDENKEGFDRKRKSTPKKQDESTDGFIRLNKFIANAGICSRREADEFITSGLVQINGKIVTELGTKVAPGDEVKFNDSVIRSEKKVYILLNKPKDYVTTVDDPNAEATVMDLIKGACKERVYPVGRLDKNTTGVLLLTNDGDLTKKLTHPSSNIPKLYQVTLDKAISKSEMMSIVEGLTLDDGFIKADEVTFADPEDKKIVGIQLHSGKNRIVRRIFEHLGFKVRKLDRVVFANLTKKTLRRGYWRFLTEKEVAYLKMIKTPRD